MHNRSLEFQPTHIPPEREQNTGALQQSSQGRFHLTLQRTSIKYGNLTLFLNLLVSIHSITIISQSEKGPEGQSNWEGQVTPDWALFSQLIGKFSFMTVVRHCISLDVNISAFLKEGNFHIYKLSLKGRKKKKVPISSLEKKYV